MKRPRPTILVSRCFSEVTPESAEHGDTSDNGFVYESQEMEVQELAREIRLGGFYREGCTEWLSTGYHTSDYSTGTEREETLHFCRENHPRLWKHFERIAAISTR
jgi:hypothetical protein